ncbi:MAG: hypothetical protein ACI9MN_000169, partial [Saprospiraceae bacterium]
AFWVTIQSKRPRSAAWRKPWTFKVIIRMGVVSSLAWQAKIKAHKFALGSHFVI